MKEKRCFWTNKGKEGKKTGVLYRNFWFFSFIGKLGNGIVVIIGEVYSNICVS